MGGGITHFETCRVCGKRCYFMEAGSSDSIHTRCEKEEDRKLASLDCKETAIELARADQSLIIVRGFALFPDGFTEHWWLRKKNQTVVDVTALRSVYGATPEYIPLDDLEPYETWLCFCDALIGPCEEPSGPCPWCSKRAQLIKKGHKRVRLKKLFTRIVMNRLYEENVRLRLQLELERDDDD